MLFFQEGPGVRNTQYTSSGVKLLNVANLVDGKVDLSTSYRYISEDEAYGKYRHFLCDEGDFIVASSGIKVDYIDKKMGFISREMLPLCMNTSTIRFKVLDGSKLNIKYFMYFLKSTAFKKQLAKQITGSAQLNYGPSHLKQMTFPLIDIKIQNDLVQKLDSIMRIIDQKNASLKKLDELVKARFVEMFRRNNIDVISVGDAVELINGRAFKPTHWMADGLPIIRIQNLNDKTAPFNYFDGIYDKKNYVKKGELLFSWSGTPGTSFGAFIWDREPGILNQHIFRVLPKIDLELNYLRYALNDQLEIIISKAHGGVGLQHITKGELEKVLIPNPNIEQQHSFSNFVAQVDKSKFAVQKSLEKTQLLFDSLMQEYFG